MESGDPLLRRLPHIRRARGYRLSDVTGRRYIDMYQRGGAAILGHRSPGTIREMKDVLSRGLTGGLPSEFEGRLVKALKGLLPAYRSIRVYSCLHRALEAASRFIGARVESEDVLDPALDPDARAKPRAAFWRPFLPSVECEVLIPILPGAGIEDFTVVCFRSEPTEEPPASDPVPPYLLAVAVKALSDLARAERADAILQKALEDAPGWRLNGPYISSLADPETYPGVFRGFLEGGVLLSPFHPGPSILPAEVSPGEIRLLGRLFHAHTGG